MKFIEEKFILMDISLVMDDTPSVTYEKFNMYTNNLGCSSLADPEYLKVLILNRVMA